MDNRLFVKCFDNSGYTIAFEKDFENLVAEISSLNIDIHKICIVTDSNVGELYADEVKCLLEEISTSCDVYTFPAGEENKNLTTAKDIYRFLIENKYERNDLLVALGGGVVGDITGFVAATYLRGVSFIQIPTTLLSQADSSIGGKTGVDFEGYKNMVGAFKMPILVYNNLSTLNSLENRQFFSGFAEIMKAALIKNSDFYEWLISYMYEICEKDVETLKEMLYQSCVIKKEIVELDPEEKGVRALLNFGHTIGHAIEKYMNFSLLHGECVSLGCVVAAYISWKKGYLSMEEFYEIRDMFVPFYLPISIDRIDPKVILGITKSDKKMNCGKLNFVLLHGIGDAFVDCSVTDEEILNALDEINFSEEDAHE